MMWYPEAWKSSPKVTAMPAAARAGYFDLLCAVWLNGASLPNDDTMLRACSRLTSSEWKLHRISILAMFTVEGGEIKNERLTREYDKTIEKIEKRKAAADARWGNKQTQSKSNANALHMECNADASRTRTRTTPISPQKLLIEDEGECDSLFDEWWEAFPRKVAKSDASKAYGEIVVNGKVKADQRADLRPFPHFADRHAQLVAATKLWAGEFATRDSDKVPYPATFLRRMDWLAAPEASTPAKPKFRRAWE